MHPEILVVLCCALVLVKSFPAAVYDYYNPETGNIEEIEFSGDYQNSKHKQSRKSILGPCLRSLNGAVKCFFNNEVYKGKLQGKQEYEIAADGRYLNQDPSADYEGNLRYLENAVVTELLPGDNPYYNVYQHEGRPTTYIHGLVPSQDAPVFNGNMYPPADPLPYIRPARKTSSYEELLAQLSHDAMMNNILPTMPFLRTPSGTRLLVPYSSGAHVQASYPHAGARGYAQPVLVGCSPIITRGVIAHDGSIRPYVPTPVIQVLSPYKAKPTVDTTKPGSNAPADFVEKYLD